MSETYDKAMELYTSSIHRAQEAMSSNVWCTVKKSLTCPHDLHVATIQPLKVRVFNSGKINLVYPPQTDTFVVSSHFRLYLHMQ